MKKLFKLFTEHPNTLEESYFEHMFCAASYGARMIIAGIAAIIHSIFPFLFETTASDLAKEITANVSSRKDNVIISEQDKKPNTLDSRESIST